MYKKKKMKVIQKKIKTNRIQLVWEGGDQTRIVAKANHEERD